MSENNYQTESAEEVSTKEPPLYIVFLLNDDFTSQDFVVKILTMYFHKNHDEAIKLMLEVHNAGKASVGVYTKDMAETKIYLVHQAAKENNFPLKCHLEPVSGDSNGNMGRDEDV